VGVPLLAELKRRRVFRALLGYAIVAFAVLQVIEPITHGLQLPDWTLSFVVVALGVGFPIVIVLAWVFDVSSSGIERTLPLGTEGGSRPSGALLAVLATAVALLGVAVLAWHFVSRTRAGRTAPSASAPAAPSVAVLPFVNMSKEKDDDLATGAGARRWTGSRFEEQWSRVVEGRHGAQPAAWTYDEFRWGRPRCAPSWPCPKTARSWWAAPGTSGAAWP